MPPFASGIEKSACSVNQHPKLIPEERVKLLKQHKSENNRKIADRIKAVLLLDDGMNNRDITRVLFLNED